MAILMELLQRCGRLLEVSVLLGFPPLPRD